MTLRLRRRMDASSVRFITDVTVEDDRAVGLALRHTSTREVTVMGLFDIIKDKAAELLSGASDKVKDLTDTELPGTEATDQLEQSAGNVAETATTVGQDLTETAQNLTGSAAEAADNAIAEAADPNK
jgi:hypothetical protein